MHRLGIAVLRVLNEEDHQEGDDRRAGVNQQLPRIGVIVEVSRGRPDDDHSDGAYEDPGSPEQRGRSAGEDAERILHTTDEAALRLMFGLSGDLPVLRLILDMVDSDEPAVVRLLQLRSSLTRADAGPSMRPLRG